MSESQKRKSVGLHFWEVLINRWATAPDIPERRLLVRVIAQSIAEAEARSIKREMPMGNEWQTPAILGYCRLIGIEPQFLIDQVDRGAVHFGLRAA